jgi:hypothetical protein
MLDLVLWSCMLALAPWALGLARKLIFGVAGLISPAAPNGSVALARGLACAGDLPRPVATGDRPTILMRSNDNLIAMSAPSLPRPGSGASHAGDGRAWSPDRRRSEPAPS